MNTLRRAQPRHPRASFSTCRLSG